MAERPVVVIGAGPAGLAAAHAISARNIPVRLFERGDRPGYAWSRLYDSLRLHTGKHLSALPGLRFARAVPLFPSRNDFLAYLDRYVHAFGIEVETGTDVTHIERTDHWRVTAGAETVDARAVVIATGIISEPVLPDIAGRDVFAGRVLHSVEYLRPAPFIGRRVLVVGVGNSGGEVAAELAAAGVDTTIAVRSGANVVPLTIAGIPIQYLAVQVRRLPRPLQERVVAAVGKITEKRRGPPVLPRSMHSPLDAIPLIGFHLVDQIRADRIAVRPGIERFTQAGVRFVDGTGSDYDHVILATGFRPALAPFGDVVQRDARGFALRSDRIRSSLHPGLYFVGHNYDASGGLQNIVRDAKLLGEALSSL